MVGANGSCGKLLCSTASARGTALSISAASACYRIFGPHIGEHGLRDFKIERSYDWYESLQTE